MPFHETLCLISYLSVFQCNDFIALLLSLHFGERISNIVDPACLFLIIHKIKYPILYLKHNTVTVRLYRLNHWIFQWYCCTLYVFLFYVCMSWIIYTCSYKVLIIVVLVYISISKVIIGLWSGIGIKNWLQLRTCSNLSEPLELYACKLMKSIYQCRHIFLTIAHCKKQWRKTTSSTILETWVTVVKKRWSKAWLHFTEKENSASHPSITSTTYS